MRWLWAIPLAALSCVVAADDGAIWQPNAARLPWLPVLVEDHEPVACEIFLASLTETFLADGDARLSDRMERHVFAPSTNLDLPFSFAPLDGAGHAEGIATIDIDQDGDDETLVQLRAPAPGTTYEQYIRVFESPDDLVEAANAATDHNELARGDWGRLLSRSRLVDSEIILTTIADHSFLMTRMLGASEAAARTATLLRLGPDGQPDTTCVVEIMPPLESLLSLLSIPEVVTLSDLLAAIAHRDANRCGGSWNPNAERRHQRLMLLQELSSAPWKALNDEAYARWHNRYVEALFRLTEWGERSIWNWRQLQDLPRRIQAAEKALTAHFLGAFGMDVSTAATAASHTIAGIVASDFVFQDLPLGQNGVEQLPQSLDAYLAPSYVVPEIVGLWSRRDADPSEFARQLRRGMLRGVDPVLLTLLMRKSVEAVPYPEPIASFALGHPAYIDELRRAHVDVNSANVFGKTALMYATQLGEIETATKLLGSESYLNAQTFLYSTDSCVDPDAFAYNVTTVRTALDYALQSGSQEMIDLLRAHGAKTAAELAGEAP